MGSAATAQQPQLPAREPQQRQVVVPTGPNEPVPELWMAAGEASYLRFSAPIDRASVEVEQRATRFKLVDAGEYTLTLEMAIEPEPGERLIVRVRFKDGAHPAHATFALVSHPTRVDKEVEVIRRPRTPEVLEAALAQCEAGGPAHLVLSGRLDLDGVQARRIKTMKGAQTGLQVNHGAGYRASTWALLAVHVHNLPGQRPWTAGALRLTRADGTRVKVLSVRMDRPRLAPGETGLLVAETETPYWKAGEVFRVELREKSDVRHFLIGTAEL
jgi:uncharacterized protein (TIGR02268 family)